MIDERLLEQLVTFADKQTLSATAKTLRLTQPTVTRNMQKLEADLGVKLFKRQSNRITLTQTGRFAVNQARQVLSQNHLFVERVKNYDHSHRVIRVATNAPGPLLVLQQLAQHNANLEVQPTLLATAKLKQELENNHDSLIISNQEIQTAQIESYYLAREQLTVNLNRFMRQANQPTIKFSELKGLSFIVLQDIGPWKEIIQAHIPDAKFLYQPQQEAFAEITNYASFPFFNTNLAQTKNKADQVQVPISDPAATMTFYVNYLKEQKQTAMSLIAPIRKQWST